MKQEAKNGGMKSEDFVAMRVLFTREQVKLVKLGVINGEYDNGSAYIRRMFELGRSMGATVIDGGKEVKELMEKVAKLETELKLAMDAKHPRKKESVVVKELEAVVEGYKVANESLAKEVETLRASNKVLLDEAEKRSGVVAVKAEPEEF